MRDFRGLLKIAGLISDDEIKTVNERIKAGWKIMGITEDQVNDFCSTASQKKVDALYRMGYNAWQLQQIANQGNVPSR